MRKMRCYCSIGIQKAGVAVLELPWRIFSAVLCEPYFLLLGSSPLESAVHPWYLRLLAHRL